MKIPPILDSKVNHTWSYFGGRECKTIKIGNIKIGGKNPVAVQSMLNADSSNFRESSKQIQDLLEAGCEIVRIAVPNEESLTTLRKLRKKFEQIPLVADIHFDHKLALQAIEIGVDKIRINPGNLGGDKNLKEVVEACKKKRIPIRVGVNGGSLEKGVKGKTLAEKLANSALENVRKIEKLGWKEIVISAKASDVRTSVEAYRLLAKKTKYPLHLGITEAGGKQAGLIKSAAGLGSLLLDGIGSTLRISLTANPVEEVKAAWDLLRACGVRSRGVDVISCPTCGRCEVDLISLVEKVEKAVEKIQKPLKIAVMGCVVNGVGESKHADFALVGGKKMFGIYAKGKLISTVQEKDALKRLVEVVAVDI